MGKDVRFIILNSDDGFASELRSLLLQFQGVKIIAELEEAALLSQAVKQFPADVVLVHLDPTPEAVLPLVGEVISANPQLTFFATSSMTDGPLILKVMRTGFKEFLPKPIDGKSLGEAVDKIAAVRPDQQEHGQLITVMGSSGGVGATTLATNLAVELAALSPRRVVLVDLDYRFGQVGTLLDVEPNYTLADLCHSPEQLEQQIIDRALVKHSSGVHVLCRPSSFTQADSITAASCVGLLSALMQSSAYVVADGPSRLEPNARAVLDVSDVNLLVMQLLVPSVRNALRIIEGMRDSGYNLDRTQLICNRVGKDSGNLTIEDVVDTLGKEVHAQIPDDWATISGAINLGEPLLTFGPRSRARIAIQKIAEGLHTPEAQSDETDTRKKGLIGRIFAAS
jgi:pilus assembly protein CpaE